MREHPWEDEGDPEGIARSAGGVERSSEGIARSTEGTKEPLKFASHTRSLRSTGAAMRFTQVWAVVSEPGLGDLWHGGSRKPLSAGRRDRRGEPGGGF